MSITTILYRNIKWRFHHAFTIIVTILQPMLWLILYSALAKQAMQASGITNYTAFLLPGLLILVSFSTCSSSGIMNYMMKTDGSFYRILIAPIKRSSIVLGQLLEAVLCTFFEVIIMCICSLFFGVRIPLDVVGIVIMVIVLFLTAFFMASIAYGISLILPNEMIYETVMNAIVLPIFFLSNALFPSAGIHGLLAFLININPFTHVIHVLRTFIVYGTISWTYIGGVILMLIMLGSLGFAWAYHQLQKETKL